MPLMSPNVQKLMRAAGLESQSQEEQSSIQEKLTAAGLGLETCLDNLSNIANNSCNEALRAKANETALKMHGALKETAAGTSQPSFTLIINDPTNITAQTPEGVNPIFIPRQIQRPS